MRDVRERREMKAESCLLHTNLRTSQDIPAISFTDYETGWSDSPVSRYMSEMRSSSSLQLSA